MKHLDKFIAFENEEIYELSLYLEFALEYAKLKDYRGTISGINYYKKKFDSFYSPQLTSYSDEKDKENKISLEENFQRR